MGGRQSEPQATISGLVGRRDRGANQLPRGNPVRQRLPPAERGGALCHRFLDRFGPGDRRWQVYSSRSAMENGRTIDGATISCRHGSTREAEEKS